MKYTVEWLKEEERKGNKRPYIGFWGNNGDTYKEMVFSNFHPSPFMVEVVDNVYNDRALRPFNCNEQYFMYRKALEFKDYESIYRILEPGHYAYHYKKLGRKVKNYDDNVWAKVRYQAMLDGLRYKFTQNEDLKAILLETGDAILVEDSPFDNVWGVKLGKKDRYGQIDNRWKNVNYWQGLNLLGFALMEIRDELNQY